jgi:hypothetical protein
MQRDRTMPPVDPASGIALRAVHDAFEGLSSLIEREHNAEQRGRYLRAREALASIFWENGAPRGEPAIAPEARPTAGDLPAVGDLCGERGIRTPDTLAGTPDFESGVSARAMQARRDLENAAVRLAWELVGKETAPRLAAWFLEQLEHVDEHDPVVCVAACCNTPVALEVQP